MLLESISNPETPLSSTPSHPSTTSPPPFFLVHTPRPDQAYPPLSLSSLLLVALREEKYLCGFGVLDGCEDRLYCSFSVGGEAAMHPLWAAVVVVGYDYEDANGDAAMFHPHGPEGVSISECNQSTMPNH